MVLLTDAPKTKFFGNFSNMQLWGEKFQAELVPKFEFGILGHLDICNALHVIFLKTWILSFPRPLTLLYLQAPFNQPKRK